MNDLDDIRRRIKQRKGQTVLNDNNFKHFYNFMIKFMVVILVVLVSLSYVKTNPESDLKKLVLNDANYKMATTWLSDTFLSFLPKQDIKVSSGASYKSLGDDFFSGDSNEVISLAKGRVIEVGKKDELGNYVVVLTEGEVTITYCQLNDLGVVLYDLVKQGTVLGSYQDKFKMTFVYQGKKLSYEAYQRMG